MVAKMSALEFTRFCDVSNWSVSHLLGDKFNYNKKYKLVKLKEFLTRNKTTVIVDDKIEYKRVTIKLYNQGVFLRDREIGKKIGTKKQFLIKEGQFLLSKIDARNGAFGVVSNEIDNAIITGNFWTFDVNYSKINPYFLSLITTTKQFMDFCQSASSGTTGRHYLDEKSFLDVEIPLPDIDIQKKIVQNYQEKLTLAKNQEKEAEEKEKEIEEYLRKELGIVEQEKIKKDDNILQFARFKSTLRWNVSNLISANIDESIKLSTVALSSIILGKPKYGSNSRGIKKITNIRYIRITDINEDGTLNDEIVSAEEVNEGYILKQDDFLIARSGNTVGKTFLYDEKYGKCIYAGYLIKFILNKDVVNPRYLLYYTKSNIYKNWIRDNLRVAGQPNINSQEYLKSPIVLPPLKMQNEIANSIEKIKNEIQNLKEQAKINKISALIEFEREIFDENK